MLKYDKSIWISEGLSREETNWKNKEILWSELVGKLQKPCQTNEKFKEYQKLDKDQRDIIKDVGGFVGGSVTGGRRVKGSVGTRFILALDLDFAPPSFPSLLALFYPNAAFIHGTHSHCKEKPRLRLIMPLSRQVYADEYEAIARRVAGDLGIDYFDDTTFQCERLMYWPSISKDATYYSVLQDKPFLNADKILSRYANWKDSSQWPVSSRVKEIPHKLKKQQEDPLEKKGVIGAFCRIYTIQQAIEEYLDDVYASTDDDNRYSYMQGSTSKGLVVYEDKFAYSHHGTDPISGKLCNAFDLVRIHLFGGLDDNVKSDTPVNKLPSFIKMSELALQTKEIVGEMGVERMERLNRFLEEDEKDFLKELEYDQNNRLKSTIQNAYLIIKHDPDLKGCFAHNLFAHMDVAMKDLPWRSIRKSGEGLKEDDDPCLRGFIEKNYGSISREKINDAFRMLMVENSFHPVKSYLESLTWDGQKRIESLLIDYFGCSDSPYIRIIIKKCLIAAVARIYDPGCEYKNVLILVGPQNKGKTTFIKRLGGEWFTDTFGPLDNMKIAMENLQGKWIVEIGELAAFKGKENSAIKLFVGRPSDWFRVAYGRRNEEFPRQCIFIGSTNEMDVLNDPTGDSRFWPVLIHPEKRKKDPRSEMSAHVIRQIWAEALQLYKSGETLFLTDEMEEIADKEKGDFRAIDPRDTLIDEYLKMPVTEDFYSMNVFQKRLYISDKENWSGQPLYKTTVEDIYQVVFGGKSINATKFNTKFIKDYFSSRSKKWDSRVIKINGAAVRGYIRIDEVRNLL